MTCAHGLVVDEVRAADGEEFDLAWAAGLAGPLAWSRRCLTCGLAYDRKDLLRRLRECVLGRARPTLSRAWREVGRGGL